MNILIHDISNELIEQMSKSLSSDRNRKVYRKLYLRKYTEFHFNIPHSWDYVVCVFNINEIGIDIERIIPIDYERIAQHYFSQNEVNYIFDKNIKNLSRKFYEIGTPKESYVKYYDKDPYIPLNSFSIDICINGAIQINDINNIAYLKLFDIDPDYKMTICSSSKRTSCTIKKFGQESLISSFLDLS